MSVLPHLERFSELVGHDVVEHRVDGRGHVVEDPRRVGERLVHRQQHRTRVGGGVVPSVHCQEPLGVERRPTDEERHHDSNCKKY